MKYVSRIKKLSKSERGTSLVEFGVLVGIISIGAIASVLVTGDEISKSFFSSQKTIGEKIDIAKKGGSGGGSGGGGGGGGGGGTPPADPAAMLMTFDATTKGSVTLPLYGAVNVTVDWGGPHSGCPTTITSVGDHTCTYDAGGVYQVSIAGTVGRYGKVWETAPGAGELVSVDQWGNLGLTSLSGAFKEAHNLTSLPSDFPTTVTDMSYMFQMSNANPTLGSSWDTSSVTDMSLAFKDAKNFNQDISGWKTQNVTHMNEMFNGATVFNSALNSWSVISLKESGSMFKNAAAFNQSLSTWDLSGSWWYGDMFRDAISFDQDLTVWCLPSGYDANWAANTPTKANGKLPRTSGC